MFSESPILASPLSSSYLTSTTQAGVLKSVKGEMNPVSPTITLTFLFVTRFGI